MKELTLTRIPFFTPSLTIAGYELVPYHNRRSKNGDLDDDLRGLISDTFCQFNPSLISDYKPIIIPCSRRLLIEDYPHLADPGVLYIDLAYDMDSDSKLDEKLQLLKKQGYKLSFNGYNGSAFGLGRSINRFDIIRVDVHRADPAAVRLSIKKLLRNEKVLMACRISSASDLALAQDCGFTYLQGPYLGDANTISKEMPKLCDSVYGELLNHLAEDSVDPDRCLTIMRKDIYFYYLFLHHMHRIQDLNEKHKEVLRDCFMGLTPGDLRRWACIALLKEYNMQDSEDLAKKAYTRALFLEELMEHAEFGIKPRKAFTLGMYSLLDQVAGVSKAEIVDGMSMDVALKGALLGNAINKFTTLLRMTVLVELKAVKLPDVGVDKARAYFDTVYAKSAERAEKAFAIVSLEGQKYTGNVVR